MDYWNRLDLLSPILPSSTSEPPRSRQNSQNSTTCSQDSIGGSEVDDGRIGERRSSRFQQSTFHQNWYRGQYYGIRPAARGFGGRRWLDRGEEVEPLLHVHFSSKSAVRTIFWDSSSRKSARKLPEDDVVQRGVFFGRLFRSASATRSRWTKATRCRRAPSR